MTLNELKEGKLNLSQHYIEFKQILTDFLKEQGIQVADIETYEEYSGTIVPKITIRIEGYINDSE